MNNEAIKKIDRLISVYESDDIDLMKEILGLSPDLDFDNPDNIYQLCDAVDEYICSSEDGIEYFFQRIRDAKDTTELSNLCTILSYTNQFDKIKEYLDAENEGQLKDKVYIKSSLMEALARSPKHQTFIRELLSNRKNFLKYVDIPDLCAINVLSLIHDADYIDSFIRRNAQEQADSKNKLIMSTEKTYFNITSGQYSRIIAQSKDPDYIKKCFFDEELGELLGFKKR